MVMAPLCIERMPRLNYRYTYTEVVEKPQLPGCLRYSGIEILNDMVVLTGDKKCSVEYRGFS